VGRDLGVLVAGGRGARLGAGVPKALVRLAGSTLLERGLATLSGICDEVVVAAPVSLGLPVLEERLAPDPPGIVGPIAGLVGGLRSRPFTRAIVLGVDFPLVLPAALAAMRQRLGDGPAVVPVLAGRIQPLVAAYTPSAVPPLRAALERGERALLPAVEALGPQRLAGADLAALPGGEAAFLNVNTTADLEEAQRRLATRAGGAA
jgi:molybdopterin-guanine dinucleotide biosynthesis protein A